METRIKITFPMFSFVNLAARRVIVKPLANGECYIVLFTDRAGAEEWRCSQCPHADLWTISTRNNLRRFLNGAMSDRTCRVTVNPAEPGNGPRPTVAIRGLLDRLAKGRRLKR